MNVGKYLSGESQMQTTARVMPEPSSTASGNQPEAPGPDKQSGVPPSVAQEPVGVVLKRVHPETKAERVLPELYERFRGLPIGTLLYATPPSPAQGGEPPHPDDAAVDRFARAMKAKLAIARYKGRGGWDSRDTCRSERLAAMLIEHIAKGDPVDIANFAMMIHQRDELGIENGTIDNLPNGVKVIAFVNSRREAYDLPAQGGADEASADTKRLDWLQATENTPWRVCHTTWEYGTDALGSRHQVNHFDGWSATSSEVDPKPTIREAIDAAMTVPQGKEQA